MNIRTKIDLKDTLDKDFGWRKLELSQVLLSVKGSIGKTKNVALRTATLLLYAHWEGFVKCACTAYLNYVKNQSLAYKDLPNYLIALSLKQKLVLFENTNKATIHTQLIDYLKSCDNDVAIIDDSNAISTGSNLKSTILKEILTTIGIDYTPFSLKANLIDEQLLNYRNTIAHGEFLKIDEKEYIKLHAEIFSMMTSIKTSIENAVALDLFKVNRSIAAP
ncbi:MAE_28990/MAE_18760 family HEPN-like nuclease [Mucilaginibacter kameinonensis]|uniref:MAE_28990/MAE_18760 family HEPN-like nuclease n=1 Tax=Mucilaginibacter kameinonensis TaxID=452286 RepID=UPI000EF7E2AA|nr:MAE_28990/MAE_18760 family HEPN-like nuclease [Mucilaginibacter kameinonensis]